VDGARAPEPGAATERSRHEPALPGDAAIAAAVPDEVEDLMARLWHAGHGAYVVGGSIRNVLLGRPAKDWDLTTNARPERVVELFPDARYENAFGTVAVPAGSQLVEITTYRSDHDYADFRRPHRVEFGDDLELDLARRDFTVNAIAWGADPAPSAEAVPSTSSARPTSTLVDPFDGRRDLTARQLRAVGDPRRRFEEDALRMVRAVRLAATLDFSIEPATLAAIGEHAALVRHLSGERISAELDRLLAAPRPSVGLRLAAETGLLAFIAPDLAAQRGVPQNKIPGEDLWDHTLRSVDAAPAERPVVRLATLLHDIGKPATLADGHFHGHERVGAELTAELLTRLRYPRDVIGRVALLVRNHMFLYEAEWSDAAVRRFIGKIGEGALDDLFLLREADNIGSGQTRTAGGLDELRSRVSAELAAGVVVDRSDLVVDGSDLQAELGLAPGPAIGRILGELVERVIADPALNDRPTLLMLARAIAAEDADP
jgi:tRNA nucleotidyltransferase (CCA-adding enzyme)